METPDRGMLTPPSGAEKMTRFTPRTAISGSLLCRPKRGVWSPGGEGKSAIINGDDGRCEGKEATDSFFFPRASVVYLIFGTECQDRDSVGRQIEKDLV